MRRRAQPYCKGIDAVGMMMDQIMTVISQTLGVIAVAFVVLTLLVSFTRFHLLFPKTGPSATRNEEESVDAFRAAILKELGTVYKDPEPFTIMTVLPEAGGDPRAQTDRIRGMVRRTDVAALYDGSKSGLLIRTGRIHAELVAQRIAAGLSSAAAIGIATCPENGTRLADLLESAENAANEALAADGGIRLAGGPQAAQAPAEPPPAQETILDDLTGVLRGDLLGRTLPKFISQHRKAGRKVAMIYCDVDNIQDYNRHYSREAGDTLLQGVSALFQKNLREDDLIARYAGDEFLILLPAEPKDALQIALRLAAIIKRAEFKYRAVTLRSTVSMGIALVPVHARTLSRLFENASHALNTAKEKGVGFCVMYEPGMGAHARKNDVIEKF